ncbi:MAG: hypothetical protein IKB51_01100, partial [Clostridia bacterium]|nr:hypothetical protein [Clostridia bacterium]
KNRNPSQGKLRENCEKRFSQSASKDAKNPIKSRVFKKLHKQTKEVFKATSPKQPCGFELNINLTIHVRKARESFFFALRM